MIIQKIREQVIGTWIDGKPIYRRVFIFIGPSKINETTILYEEKSTIDTIVSLDGYQKFTNGGGAPINARMNNSSQWGLTVWCNPNYNGNMDIRAHTDSSGFTNSTINLVLEYTKTTD